MNVLFFLKTLTFRSLLSFSNLTVVYFCWQTADENWKTCILNEAAKIIYKVGLQVLTH